MTKARDLANASTALSAVSATELAFVDGVTSAIQTQMDAKASLTGTETLTNKTLTNPVIASVINNTLTSTTGDIIYASAANTPARLGIGSSAQVLTVASGVPSWATASAGGMTVIASGNLTNGAASITISSIPDTYKNLQLVIRNFKAGNPYDGDSAFVRVNSDSTSNRHAAVQIGQGGPNTFTQTYWQLDNGQDDTVSQYLSVVDFNDYANTTTWKTAQMFTVSNNAATSTSYVYFNRFCIYNQTDAISSLLIGNTTGPSSFGSGATYILYGVK